MSPKKIPFVDVHERGMFMIDERERECDFCDQDKKCASINWIGNTVIVVCQDCLQQFIDGFKEDSKEFNEFKKIYKETREE